MNEEALKGIYNDMGFEAQGVSYEDYLKTMESDPNARQSVYNDMGFESQGISLDDYESTLGFKKKDQAELVQEDTESVSEVGSSESPSVSLQGEDILATEVPAPDQEAGIIALDETQVKPEDVELDLTEEEKRIEQVYSKQMDEADVEKAKNIIPDTFKGRYLDKPSELEIDELYDQIDGVKRSSIAQVVASKRNQELDSLADTFTKNQINSLKDKYAPEMGEEAASIAATEELYKDTQLDALSRIGLDEQELKEYKDVVFKSADGIRKMDALKKQFSSETDPLKKKELYQQMKQQADENLANDSIVRRFREDYSRKSFVDEYGNVNQELKKQSDDKVAQFDKEYKSDYNKIIDRMIKERSKMKSLREDFLNNISPEDYQLLGGDERVVNQGTDKEQALGAKTTVDRFFDYGKGSYIDAYAPNLKNKADSYIEAYKEAEKNFEALSRLVLLREDPAEVERGFGSFGDVPYLSAAFEKAGEFLTSAGESFYETRLGLDYSSDKDYRERVGSLMKEEGITLNPEQLEAVESTGSEMLGDLTGTSLDIGFDILAARNLMGAGMKMVNLPKYLSRIEKVRKMSPRAVKFIENVADNTLQGVAFELASDQTDFAMGFTEGGASKGMDALVNSLSKSKYGKFLKYLDNYAGRFAKEVTGRTVGGVVEEYAGDFVSEGVKNGFFTEEQFENTFGTGEEAVEKFFLTVGSVGIMSTPTAVVDAAKKSLVTSDNPGELQRAIDAYEASEEAPTRESVQEGVEAVQEAESGVLDDVSEEDLELLTADEPAQTIETDGAQEGEQLPSTVEEGQESRGLQVDETSEEEVAASGVLQEEEQRFIDEAEEPQQGTRTDFEVGDKFNWDFVGEEVEVTRVTDDSVTFIDPRSGRERTFGKASVLADINDPNGTTYSEIETTQEVTPTIEQEVEGDTFTTEELDQEITEDTLQRVYDRLDKYQRKLRATMKADVTGITAALDAVLTLTKKGLKAGMTLRDAFNKARTKYQSKEAYRNLSEEDRAKIDALDEEGFFGELEVQQGQPEAPKGLNDAYNAARDTYQDLRDKGQSVEEAMENSLKTLQRSEWYNNLSEEEQADVDADWRNKKVETFEKPNPKKNKKGMPDTKDTSDKVETTEKEVLLERLRNQQRGAQAAKKGIKELQKQFKNDLNESLKYLTEAQRKVANNLMTKVNDAKSLRKTQEQLANLVEYGKLNPKTSDKVDTKGKEEQTVISNKELNKRLLKAEEAAAKNLSKEQQALIKSLREKFKKLGKQSKANTKAILDRFAKVGPAKNEQVLEFSEYLDRVIADSEYRNKRELLGKLQERLQSKIKSVGKKIQTGVRFEKARELARLNLNRLSSLDGVEEVITEVTNSIGGKQATFDNVSEELDMIINEAAMNERKFMERKNALDEAALAKEYNESDAKDTVSFEKYKKLRAKALKNDLANERMEISEEEDFAMRKWLKDRISNLSKFRDEVTEGMTKKQKAIVGSIIRNADLLNRKDLLGSDSVLKLSNAIDEILSYESTSGTSIAAIELDALRGALRTKKELKGLINPGSFFAKTNRGFLGMSELIRSQANLTSFFRSITKTKNAAQKIGFETVSEFNRLYSKARQESDTFNKKLKERSKRYGINEAESFRIGVISRLRQNRLGITEEQKQADLEDKVEAIKKEIEVLENSSNKQDRRLGKKLKTAFESLGLDKVESKADLMSKLTSDETKWLTETEQDFIEIQDELSETYRNDKGQELEIQENYMPLFASRRSKEGVDLESEYYNSSIDTDASGRTVKRKRVDKSGNTSYNYDVLRTASEGYYQNRYDVNTLYARQVLGSLVKSKPFRELLGGKDGLVSPELYNNFVDALTRVSASRKRSSSLDNARKSEIKKITERVYKATLSLPLKTTSQLLKQPVSIIANTLVRSPKTTGKAFSVYMKAIRSKVARNQLQKLMANSNVPLRSTLGDLDIKQSEGLSEYLMGKTKATRAIRSVTSDALGNADLAATQGSWLAFYMQERAKQEGKGYKFDLEAESKNPNLEAINAANMESDVVNNISDNTTKTGKNMQEGFKNLLFLFKSFTINQNINSFIDMSKIRNDPKNAIKASIGTLVSIMAFNAMKDLVIKKMQKEALGLLTDYESDDDDLQEQAAKSLVENVAKSLVDMFIGGAPDAVIDNFNEVVVNGMAGALGSEEDIIKVFRQDPGVMGLGHSYGKGLMEDIDILTDADDEFYTDDMKMMAWADILGLLLMDGNLKRQGEFGKRQLKKQGK